MALRFETFSRVEDIDKALWNELATSASPMMEWEYFNALEKSNSVSAERGYRPCHLVAYSDGEPVAMAPLYERDRAWVEFGDGGLITNSESWVPFPLHLFRHISFCIAHLWILSKLMRSCSTILIFCVSRGSSPPRAYTSFPRHPRSFTQPCLKVATSA